MWEFSICEGLICTKVIRWWHCQRGILSDAKGFKAGINAMYILWHTWQYEYMKLQKPTVMIFSDFIASHICKMSTLRI